MKKAIMFFMMLFPCLGKAQHIDMIVSVRSLHFVNAAADRFYRYNEANVNLIDGTLGLRWTDDVGKELSALIAIDSYGRRMYACIVQKPMISTGIITVLFGAGVAYKQVNAAGLNMLVCAPVPSARLALGGFKLDFSGMPAKTGLVVWSTLSVNVF